MADASDAAQLLAAEGTGVVWMLVPGLVAVLGLLVSFKWWGPHTDTSHHRLEHPPDEREHKHRSDFEHTTRIMERPRSGGVSVRLFTQKWLPKADPKGLIVYTHGLHAHTSRWYGLPHALEAGYAVAAMDQEGHGRSSGVHGFVPSVEQAAADLAHFVKISRADFPDKHCFLVGGSWGGQLCLMAASELKAMGEPHLVDGLSLQCPLIDVAGEADPPELVVKFAQAVTYVLPKLPLVPGAKGRTAAAELAERHAQEDADDPLVYSGNLRIGTGLSLKAACARLNEELHLVDHPFLLQHGTADRAVSISGSHKLFKRSTSTDKTFHQYDGGEHDLERERPHISEKVHRDFVSWLDTQVLKSPPAVSRGGGATESSTGAGAGAGAAAGLGASAAPVASS